MDGVKIIIIMFSFGSMLVAAMVSVGLVLIFHVGLSNVVFDQTKTFN